MSIVGNKLKQIRSERGVSQYRLSKLSGVAQSTISAIEAEGQTRSPAIDTIEKLALALDCKASDIMGEEHEKKPGSEMAGQRNEVVKMLTDLSADDLQRVRDFVSGIKAARAK